MALSTDKSSKPYVRYLPFVPNGEVNIPPSKSDVHRAIICAALTRGKCTIASLRILLLVISTIGILATGLARRKMSIGSGLAAIWNVYFIIGFF